MLLSERKTALHAIRQRRTFAMPASVRVVQKQALHYNADKKKGTEPCFVGHPDIQPGRSDDESHVYCRSRRIGTLFVRLPGKILGNAFYVMVWQYADFVVWKDNAKMKTCEFGHSWDEKVTADCPVCTLNKKLQQYMRQGMFGSAKNLAEWYVHMGKDRLQGDLFPEIAIAFSAWELSDLAFAAEKFTALKDRCGPADRQKMEQYIQQHERMKEMSAGSNQNPIGPDIYCNDARVEKVLRRLGLVFYDIRHPIEAYVPNSKEDYNAYRSLHLPGVNTEYATFRACCFYNDPDAYHLIIRKDVADQQDENSLTGLCAHEMAHLELNDKGIRSLFFRFASPNCREDMHMNERLTDLYVISKGLAYPLWCNRKPKGKESPMILDRDTIYSLICKLDRCTSWGS